MLQRLNPLIKALLAAYNQHRFDANEEALLEIHNVLEVTRTTAAIEEDDFLTDLYVLDRYADLLETYGVLWNQILNQQFSASWSTLQGALNLLRLIKRFSGLDVRFFEDQLLELEQAYPYNIFLSIGATVEVFECSICGQDMTSPECPHICGDLYKGVMARRIVRNISELDHVSFVTHPEDKRCVVIYEDTAEQFKIIRYIAELINTRGLRVLDFDRIRFTKRNIPNPEYVQLGRNDLCYCGSGNKFKKCCMPKENVESNRADIVFGTTSIEDIVAV
ncbi:MAG: SEC-C domain-containing protein [Actinomycetota bacterium]|nr:SEC-C domain-containing protein [Actinomycetota bacterium]